MRFLICFVDFCLFHTHILKDTDYSTEEFPSGACILDYMRCSIAFKTPKELLDAVEFVIDEIEMIRLNHYQNIANKKWF